MRLTAFQILDRVRTRLNDRSTSNPKWSDEELLDYLNNAIEHVCERTKVLVESTNTAVTQITIVADDPQYTLSDFVLGVERAQLASTTVPLAKRTTQFMDDTVPNWLDTDSSDPQIYILDYQEGDIRLWPPPETNDTLNMVVTILPLTEISVADLTVYPAIPQFHEDLPDGVIYQAYQKDSPDTFDLDKSTKIEEIWLRKVAKMFNRWQLQKQGRKNIARPRRGAL